MASQTSQPRPQALAHALHRSAGFALLRPASRPELDATRILTMSGTIAINLLAMGLLMMPLAMPPPAIDAAAPSHDPIMRQIPKEKPVPVAFVERVKVLTSELYKIERQTVAEFGLPMYAPLSPASLKRHLAAQKTELEEDIEAMQQDLAQVPDDRFFKRWLRQQHELRHDEFDPFDFASL